MTDNSKIALPTASPPVLLDRVESARDRPKHHPIAGPSDAERYRWIRANRGNIGIVDALSRCDKDADFDERIAAEMAMSAAGMRTYQLGPGRL